MVFHPPLLTTEIFPLNFPVISRLISILLWSLPLFRVRGIQLAIHFSFFLLLGYAAYEGWEMGAADGEAWSAALVSTGALLAMFTCVILHEFGHSFTAQGFGIGVRRILLLPIGGMAEFETLPRRPVSELLITLAGPAVNFAIAGLLALLVDMPADWDPFSLEYPVSWVGFAQLLIHWNLAMGLFNLFPAFPMDGGRILRALLATKLPYLRATYLAATLGKILAGTSIVVFAYEGIYLTAALFTFIIVAGELEYRAARRREAEDAHWRAYLARNYHLAPDSDDPSLVHRQ